MNEYNKTNVLLSNFHAFLVIEIGNFDGIWNFRESEKEKDFSDKDSEIIYGSIDRYINLDATIS